MNKTEIYFEALAKKDFRCDLEPMRRACRLFHDPQVQYPTVHIVGTNGKGSTAAFLESLLREGGLKTGLITSPHLVDLTERIQINREPIAGKELEALVERIRPQLPEENFLSFFEMITLLGFLYFSEKKVDIAVVESGMGGRLDATNLLKPKLVLVTPISLDHQNYLGETLTQIAVEKCAVFKPGATVISAPQMPAVASVIEAVCQKMDLSLKWSRPEAVTQPLGLHGQHQKTNAALALCAAQKLLTQTKLDVILAKALLKTNWPGRLQYIQKNPPVLIDGAHNLAGIQALVDYLKEVHPKAKIHFLIGVLKDKNWEEMFLPLVPLANSFFCVTPVSKRALPAEKLAEHLRQHCSKPIFSLEEPIKFSSVIPAKLAPAGSKQGAGIQSDPSLRRDKLLDPRLRGDDIVLVATGSLYMIGEILQYVSTNTTETA